jgi:hypothetical protein
MNNLGFEVGMHLEVMSGVLHTLPYIENVLEKTEVT